MDSQPQFPGGNCCLEKKVKQLETVSNGEVAGGSSGKLPPATSPLETVSNCLTFFSKQQLPPGNWGCEYGPNFRAVIVV
jgi:hypothetical protein